VGQLGVGEQAVRNEPAARGPVAAGKVVEHDAAIVLACGPSRRPPREKGKEGVMPVPDTSAAEAKELITLVRKLFHRKTGWLPEDMAPPIEVHLFRLYLNHELPEELAEEVGHRIASFRSWTEAFLRFCEKPS